MELTKLLISSRYVVAFWKCLICKNKKKNRHIYTYYIKWRLPLFPEHKQCSRAFLPFFLVNKYVHILLWQFGLLPKNISGRTFLTNINLTLAALIFQLKLLLKSLKKYAKAIRNVFLSTDYISKPVQSIEVSLFTFKNCHFHLLGLYRIWSRPARVFPFLG